MLSTHFLWFWQVSNLVFPSSSSSNLLLDSRPQDHVTVSQTEHSSEKDEGQLSRQAIWESETVEVIRAGFEMLAEDVTVELFERDPWGFLRRSEQVLETALRSGRASHRDEESLRTDTAKVQKLISSVYCKNDDDCL